MVKMEELVEKFRDLWLEEKATEVTRAKDAIVRVFKEMKVSLPAAVFAVDLVKMELVRGQLEEFLGHVKLTEELPLKPPKESA